MATKTVRQSEQSTKEAIVLQSGLSLEELMTKEIAPFIVSVNEQIESDDPMMQETATMAAREFAGALLDDRNVEKKEDVLAVRDRLAEIYFSYLGLAERVRKAVQQAEIIARRHERFADCIRGSIEAWCLTSWDSKRISGHYREYVICKNPDKLNVVDESQIPEQFFDPVPATKVLNKTRLAQWLKDAWAAYENAKKSGIAMEEPRVPGAFLERARTRLDIK